MKTSLQAELEPKCGHRWCLNEKQSQQVTLVPGGVWREASTAAWTTSAHIDHDGPPRQPATSSVGFYPFLAAIALLQGTTLLANPGARLYSQTYRKFLQDWHAVIQRHKVGVPNHCLLLPFLTV